jgi:hypothetical protein
MGSGSGAGGAGINGSVMGSCGDGVVLEAVGKLVAVGWLVAAGFPLAVGGLEPCPFPVPGAVGVAPAGGDVGGEESVGPPAGGGGAAAGDDGLATRPGQAAG